MLDKILKTVSEVERKPQTAEITAIGVAFAAILILSLLFKVWWMPRGEKYVRGCMQDTALTAAKFPDARKLAKKGANMHPRLYATLPLLSPKNKPGNALMRKAGGFCHPRKVHAVAGVRLLHAGLAVTLVVEDHDVQLARLLHRDGGERGEGEYCFQWKCAAFLQINFDDAPVMIKKSFPGV